jgi:dTDP-glucose 4,6-dehydratase
MYKPVTTKFDFGIFGFSSISIIFVHGDIRKKEDVERVAKDVDVIVNFAAETHVGRLIVEAGSFILTDVYGTYNLLEACRKFDVKNCSYFY